MTDARPTDPIDFIEFHDGKIDHVERRSESEVAIVFDHLYVCIRSGNDHAGWSYRAELVLTGVSRFEQDGEIGDPSTRKKGESHYISDGKVCDATGVEVDLRLLLDGAPAANLVFGYLSPEYITLRADVTHAKLTFLEAIKRMDDCDVNRHG